MPETRKVEMGGLPWDNQRKVLMVLAHRDFNDDEHGACARVFAASGFDVVVCSTRTGWITGSFGTRIEVGLPIEGRRPGDFAAVVFVGGDGAADLADVPAVRRFAADAVASGCVVGAICAAPLVLARAGILDMRRATCHPTYLADLVSLGAVMVDEPVVVAGWIVTASGPSSAVPFAEAVVRLVEQRAATAQSH